MPVPAFIPVIAIAARRRQIVRRFEEAGADRPENARTLMELGVHETHLVSRLARSGVLAPADGGRYFLSPDGLARWNRRRKAYLFGVASALVVIALAMLFFLRGR